MHRAAPATLASLLALAAVAFSALSVEAADDPCAEANLLRDAGLWQEAHEQYQSLVSTSAPSRSPAPVPACALIGIHQADQHLDSPLSPIIERAIALWATLTAGEPPISIGLALAVLVLAGFYLRGLGEVLRSTSPGRVQATVSGPGKKDDDIPTAALTARFQQELAASGVLPSAGVPVPSIGESLVTAVAESPLKSASWLVSLGQAVVALLRSPSGHKAAVVLEPGASGLKGVRVSLTLTDLSLGDIDQADVVTGRDEADAVDNAARLAYTHVVNHEGVREATAVWRRWTEPHGAGLAAYQAGAAKSKLGDIPGAIAELRRAGELEPLNLLIRLQLGNELENSGDFLSAVQVYSGIIAASPRLPDAHYRLAAALSFVDRWEEAWIALPLDEKALRWQLIAGKAKPPSDRDISRAALTEAMRQWRELDHTLGPMGALRRWAETFVPGAEHPEERSYWGRLAGPSTRSLRARVRRSIAISAACTSLQLETLTEQGRRGTRPIQIPDHLERVVRREVISRDRVEWTAYYNLACFYALSARAAPQTPRRRRAWAVRHTPLVETVIHHLNTALARSGGDLNASLVRWVVAVDPDLARVRIHPMFRLWASTLGATASVRVIVKVPPETPSPVYMVAAEGLPFDSAEPDLATVELHRVGTLHWAADIVVPLGGTVRYKYTLGPWIQREVSATGSRRGYRSITPAQARIGRPIREPDPVVRWRVVR